MKLKTATLFIRSSAGEMEWILPILLKLQEEGFKVKVCFLFQRGQKSCLANSTCRMGFSYFEPYSAPIFYGFRSVIYESLNRVFAYVYKKAERYGVGTFIKALDIIAAHVVRYLGWNHVSDIAFIEFPADKSIFGGFLRSRGARRHVFYFPHSPHVYGNSVMDEGNIEVSESRVKNVYLFGDHRDFLALKEGGWSPIQNSKSIYIGHPKLSSDWTLQLRSWFANDKLQPTSVAVLSRGVGNFLSEAEQRYLCETTLRILSKYEQVTNILIKLHPRETKDSFWCNLDAHHIKITEKSIAQLYAEVDLVIGFWTSAALDAVAHEKVFLEFFRPSVSPTQQLFIGGEYLTVYQHLGMAHSAKCEDELCELVEAFLNGDLSPAASDPQIKSLIARSNNWWDLMCEGVRNDTVFKSR